MARGQEEASTSQVGCRRGPSRELPSVSILVFSMSMEELRSYCQILDNISLELSDGPVASTIGEADNAVCFTQEQFAVGLYFLISSLVKQFLHVCRAPPVLIHMNTFRILMGCSVLNLLYQLDISLVEICFGYMLKLKIVGRLLISIHNPRLQFITGLLDSPKTEARGLSWLGALGMRCPTLSSFLLT